MGHIEDGVIIERGAEMIFPHIIIDWKMIAQDKFHNRKTFLAVLFPASESALFFSRPMSQSLAESTATKQSARLLRLATIQVRLCFTK